MKYILSVSKKRHSKWKIYYKEYDDYEEKFIFKSKNISRLLIPYYKLKKHHRTLGVCPECNTVFTYLHNWYHRWNNSLCPSCEQYQ